jgi:hypothetical protein
MPVDVTEEHGAMLFAQADAVAVDEARPAETRLGHSRLRRLEPARLSRRPLARVCRQTLVVVLGAFMLLWFGLANGRPSVFADTALYYSQAEYLADAIGLVAPNDNRIPRGDPTALPAHPGEPNVSALIDGGRSPIYGLFVYGLERAGGLWMVAAAQALMVALALYLLFRAAAPLLGDFWYLLWMAAISAVTSAPAFSSFIMPDILGGVAGVAGLTILVYWDRLAWPSRAAVFTLLVFSLSAHRANLLALIGLMAAGVIWLALAGLTRRRIAVRAIAVLGAATAAFGLVALAFVPINHRAGETVRDPPFLMARILADGPGRRYLQYACDHGSPLALCRFRDLPAEDSDTLLWSHRIGRGLFGVSDYPTRVELETQEHGFVLRALAYAPMDELVMAGKNTLRQLGMTHVQSPYADPARFIDDGYWRRTSLMRIIPDAQACHPWGRCGSRLSQPIFSMIQDAALALSLLALGGFTLWRVARRTGYDAAFGDQDHRLLGLVLLASAFVVFNAAVCGALSAPVPRYQARLIWMIPALALLIGGVLARRWRTRIDQATPENENSPSFSAT